MSKTTRTYPAYVHQDPDGSASGFFPGVPGCYFAGESFEEALADAARALDAHLELLAEQGEAIPEPTAIHQHQRDEDCTEGAWGITPITLQLPPQ